jgi:hypothetical protein
VRRSDLTPCVLAAEFIDQRSSPSRRTGQRSGAANHRPEIFRAYRLAPDDKLIDLEAANAQLLSCGVADSETTHSHRAYRKRTNGCRASGECARSQRPQRHAAGGDATNSDASDLDGWQIYDCAFCAMHDILPAHNVSPLSRPVFG